MGSLFLSMLIAAAGVVQDADPGAAVDELASQVAGPTGPGFCTLVVRDGEVVLEKAYGLAHVERDEPLTTDHAFYLASVSKAFTAMAVLILVEREELSLDQSILDFFPDMPEEWEPITVHHLLVHTSGLRDHFRFEDDLVGRTNEDVLGLMLDHGELDFEIGDRHQYSNSGYVLASMIVADVSGMSYAEFMRCNVFEPLGMNRTVVWDETHPDRGLLAQGYLASSGIGGPKPVDYQLYTTGAGGMFTTVRDMARWDLALFDDSLVGADTREQFFRPRVERGEVHYGYGWIVEQHAGHDVVQHSGGLPGFNTYFIRCPDQRTSVVILANVSGAIPVSRLGKAIFDVFVDPVEPEAVDETSAGR